MRDDLGQFKRKEFNHLFKLLFENLVIKNIMKNICFLVLLILLSCSSKKNTIDSGSKTVEKEKLNSNYNISREEKNIINDFLKERLKNKIYENYKNYDLVIMEESIPTNTIVSIYENCYRERNFKIKSSTNLEWILDSLDLNQIKVNFKNENKYLWKPSDFSEIKVEFLKTEDLRKSIQLGDYTELKKRLLFYLSKPLIIDNENAFVYINSGDSFFGFETIEKVVVLLKKRNDKWEIDSYYYPNSVW